jgi:basic membrane protein A
MDFGRISRRQLLQGSAALALGSTIGTRGAKAADTTIGFIYVGSRDDYGYNQAHAQGAAALKKLPGLKVVEEEKVPRPTPWKKPSSR